MATTATKPQKRKRQAAKPSRLANCDSDADVRASLKEYRPANRACEWMDVVLILRHNNDGDNDVIGSFEVFDYSGHGCERLYSRLVKAAREHVEESKSSQAPSDSEATIPPDKVAPISIQFTFDGHELTTFTFDGDSVNARKVLFAFQDWFDTHMAIVADRRSGGSLDRGIESCDRLFGEAVTA